MIDLERLKAEHGLAQARKESERADPLAARVGTKLFRDGHRKGFWDGVEHVLAHLDEFVDWRTLAGFPAGRVFAQWLRVGDTILVSGVEGVVETHKIVAQTVVLFTVRTAAGRRVECTRGIRDEVRVLAYRAAAA